MCNGDGFGPGPRPEKSNPELRSGRRNKKEPGLGPAREIKLRASLGPEKKKRG